MRVNVSPYRELPSRVILFKLVLIFAYASEIYAEDTDSSTTDAPCISNNKFYRNPNAPTHKIWTNLECAKYYLCLGDEVFEFKCSEGLLFDVSRQICDFEAQVDNCDIIADEQPPKPLLENGDCGNEKLACGDGSCLPAHYFCDGSVDCPDGSDEGWCDIRNDFNISPSCDPARCVLPDCFCSADGKQPPKNLSANSIPQMIMITFDDAVNSENFNFYNRILTEDRKNPNGCPIKATFYVSHQYTNYRDVQYLWNAGHEIAIHSISHRGPEEWWTNNATIEDWYDEMIGAANIVNKFAAVRLSDIKGLRVPFLRVGWNRQFLMMSEFGFNYDSSIVAPFSDPPFWPYTMDQKMPHECVAPGQICPTRPYRGIWEIPLNPAVVGDSTCTTMATCTKNLSEDDIYKTLMLNFKRHYLTNRAPLGLHLHSTWLHDPVNLYAFTRFVDDLLRMPDVYFTTSQETLDWIRNPTPLDALQNFAAWQCRRKHLEPHEYACDLPHACKLSSKVLKSYRYLYTCFECPKQYPWLRNEFGLD